jgi:NitT/TauT family transport system substrate-binding protein
MKKAIIAAFTVLTVWHWLAIGQSVAAQEKGAELKKIRFGVSYIPSVQFAPLYVAQAKGFYAQEGLEVALEYGYENDFIVLAGQGEREFALASGDQVILARSQGIPVTYVMTWHTHYPVALMARASEHITDMSRLAGKSVGIPGFFGASYIGWKALVYASGIDESQVTLKQIGFTQASAIQQNLVDAAVVYIVNEPIQLRNAGIPVTVIEVSDYIDLVSNGLIVGDGLMRSNPELVVRMVRATRRGIEYASAHSDEAFAIARRIVPEITDETAPVQRQVLTTSIALWQSSHPGESSRQAWQDSVAFMLKTGLLKKKVKVDDLFTNQFLPQK